MFQRFLISSIILSMLACAPEPASEVLSPDTTPLELVSTTSKVEVEVTSLGLDGYVSTYDNPVVMGYRIQNNGPAVTLFLELYEWSPDSIPMAWNGDIMDRCGLSPLEVAVGTDRTLDSSWIIPIFQQNWSYGSGVEGAGVFLLARDREGNLVAAARIPEPRTGGKSIAVIASSAEDALVVQNEIRRASVANVVGLDVIMLSGDPPETWYEYESARTVVLARPWSSLGIEAREAIARWVTFGGRLVLLPPLCADWRDSPFGEAFGEGVIQRRHGAGQVLVAVEEVIEGGVAIPGSRFRGILPYITDYPQEYHAAPVLKKNYVLPDIWLLAAFIGLVVILIGPVTHIVLSRFRRRELAWIAVPALSILLAVGMYWLASAVKGEHNALEVHHVMTMFDDSQEALVSTGTRMLSAQKGVRELSISAVSPRPSASNLMFMNYRLTGKVPNPTVFIGRDKIMASNLHMQRWSNVDFSFISVGEQVPLEVNWVGEDSLVIVNTGSHALQDIHVNLLPDRWQVIEKPLVPGASVRVDRLSEGSTAYDLFADSDDRARGYSAEANELNGLLSGVSNNRVDGVAIVAGCKVGGLPEIVMSPTPDNVETRTTCVWVKSLRDVSGGNL